jgi:hypothetical protein
MRTFHFLRPRRLNKDWQRARVRSGGRRKARRSAAWRSAASNFPRNSSISTRAGRKWLRRGATHAPSALKPAVGGEHVQVRVQRERAPPGVQRGEEGGRGAEILRIPEQLEEHFAHRRKKQLRHRCPIPAPQRVELVRDRENQMMVRAAKQPRAASLQPALHLQRLALRTDALVTGIVERALDVPLGTAAHVSAELGGAAA